MWCTRWHVIYIPAKIVQMPVIDFLMVKTGFLYMMIHMYLSHAYDAVIYDCMSVTKFGVVHATDHAHTHLPLKQV